KRCNCFYAWLGRNSIEKDIDNAISKMSNMAASIKGHPVLINDNSLSDYKNI
ncbi:hypothetical protein FRX31_009390, partial [Thalictrum thalictroides]